MKKIIFAFVAAICFMFASCSNNTAVEPVENDTIVAEDTVAPDSTAAVADSATVEETPAAAEA